jgi:Xaa-Pro aminopeptidase
VKFLPKPIFETRSNAIRTYLAANGLEALVVSTPDNFFFVSNFFLDVAPWERPVAAVLPLNAEPFQVMNELSQNHLRMAQAIGMLWINDWTYYVEHPRQVNRRWTVPRWTALLAEKLEERGIMRGKLAVDGSAANIQFVKNYLPSWSLRTLNN